MAQVKLSWDARPVEEEVVAYKVLLDDAVVAEVVEPEAELAIEPGRHKFEVMAANLWGNGPVSDPKFSPSACGKVENLHINITINVNV
jgi:hypothetical protein